MRAAHLMAAALLLAAQAAAGRRLAQGSNPFLAAAPPGSPAPAAPAPAPPQGPAAPEGAAAPAAAPAVERTAAAAAAPAAEAAAVDAAAPPAAPVEPSGDPCACTATGVSGGTNTSVIGCGQHDVAQGSNRWTWWVGVGGRASECAGACRGMRGAVVSSMAWVAAAAASQHELSGASWSKQPHGSPEPQPLVPPAHPPL